MKMLTFKKCLAATLAMALQITGAYGAILIDYEPQDITAVDGTTVNFTILASSDTGKTLTYQWFKNSSTLLSGKTSNKLTISGTKSSDAGQYQVVITELGVTPPVTFTSEAVNLTVNVRPVIAEKPVSYAGPIQEGQPAIYAVTMNALGTAPFTYTWQRKVGKTYIPLVTVVGTEGAVPVVNDNATASVLTSHSSRLELSDVQLDDVGTYRVQVTNVTGTVVNSSDFSLKVNSRPVILTQPVPDTNLALGSSMKLKVVAGGNTPMTYQWFKNGAPLTKTNSSSLTIKGTSETLPATPDVYRVEIFNPISPSVTDTETSVVTTTKTVSANANVHVIRKPVIQFHPAAPASVSIVENPVNQTLSVTMLNTTNPGNYQFQWQKDGKNIVDAIIASGPSPRTISGALTNTLSLTPVAWLDRGSYRVIVKNEVGSITSKSTTLKIVSPPVIISQSPSAVFGNVGGSIKLFVVAGGTSSFKYEWFYRPAVVGADFGPTPISKSASFTLSKLTAARDGDYYCKVSNLSNPTTGTVNSANIFLKVDIAPKIEVQTSVVVPAPDGYTASTKVTRGGSVRLQVAVSGTNTVENPIQYRWQKNKKDIIGAPSSPTLDLIDALLTDGGKYRCVISNFSGSITSKELTIVVQDPPSITVQPVDVIDQYEDSKLETIAVKATGAATLRYKWQKQYSNPMGGVGWLDLSSQKSSKLSIASSDADRDSGVYRCIVTNDVGEDISDEIDIAIKPIPVAELGPVAGISDVDFYPSVARSGELVRIFGTDLRFTKSVKFGTASVTPVIESDNSILVKVPSLAPITATSIEVVSKRGSSFTGSAFRRTTIYENVFINYTNYNNSTIIPFSSSQKKYAGDNTYSADLAASEPEGPVWYYFEIPVNYRLSVQVSGFPNGGKAFDTSLALYEEGTSSGQFFYGPDGITQFRRTPTKTSSWIGLSTERVEIDVRSPNVNVKTKKYMVQLYGELFVFRESTVPYGKFDLTVIFTKLTPVASTTESSIDGSESFNEDKTTDLQKGGDQNSISEVARQISKDEICLGGTAYSDSEPVVLSYESRRPTSTSSTTTTTFDVALNSGGQAGDDNFSYQFTDQNGDPLFAIWISSSDGAIRFVQPDGISRTSSLKVPLNAGNLPFEVVINPESATWSVTINGVTDAEPMALRSGAQFGQVSAVWDLGQDRVSSGASMTFSRFKVENSVAP